MVLKQETVALSFSTELEGHAHRHLGFAINVIKQIVLERSICVARGRKPRWMTKLTLFIRLIVAVLARCDGGQNAFARRRHSWRRG